MLNKYILLWSRASKLIAKYCARVQNDILITLSLLYLTDATLKVGSQGSYGIVAMTLSERALVRLLQ